MKVLFVCLPEHGHLHPLLEAAKRLAASHPCDDVTFAAPEHTRARVDAAGVAFLSLGAWEPEQLKQYDKAVRSAFDAHTSMLTKLKAGSRAQIQMAGTSMAAALLAHLTGFAQERMPDVIVTDSLTVAGYEVAELLRLPLAVVHQFPLNQALIFGGCNSHNLAADVPFESLLLNLPARGCRGALMSPVLKRAYAAAVSAVFLRGRNRVRAALGLPPARGAALEPQAGVPRVTHICGCSLVLNTERLLPPGWHVVGPMGLAHDACVWGPKDKAVRHFLDEAAGAGARVVYAATGTMVVLQPPQVAAMAAAFLQLAEQHGVRVIWSLKEASHALLPASLRAAAAAAAPTKADSPGAAGRCSAAGSQPRQGGGAHPGRVLVVPWANQQAVLGHPQVGAFLTHAGLGSTHEGLAAGKPLLCLPFTADQPTNAAQVQARGLGLTLSPKRLNPERLAAALHRLLTDQAFAAAAAAAGARLWQERGADAAAALLRRFAEAGEAGEGRCAGRAA